MEPLLKIDGVCREFREGGLSTGKSVRVLQDIDLDVYAGDTLGLVGESGSGKTTLARCALRLLEPDAGAVYFDNSDLGLLSAKSLRAFRRKFQMIFQDASASLDPRMTIAEILQEPYEAHLLGSKSERTQWVEELIDTVSLDSSLLRRYPSQLSGGQQQRVVIARALALKPHLLIADEPVSSLDVSVQAQILNLLADMRRRFGLTLILISHSLYAVHYLCTRIAVMYLGRIVEEAEAAQFFSQPRHPYSQALLASMPKMEDEPSGHEAPAGEIPSSHNPPSGCPFHPRCPQAISRCREELPQLTPRDGGGKVACFRA
jgi:peptide/nickel transport system ATP-binding protein